MVTNTQCNSFFSKVNDIQCKGLVLAATPTQCKGLVFHGEYSTQCKGVRLSCNQYSEQDQYSAVTNTEGLHLYGD